MVEMKYPIPEEMFSIPSISTDRKFFVRITRLDEETMKLTVNEFIRMGQKCLYEGTWKEKLMKVDNENHQ